MAKFYDYGPLLGHNAVLCMAIGGRGIGKTYGAKKLVINDFIRGGWHFMYVRRYKDEIKKAARHFFDDIVDAYPDYLFRMQGYEAQIAPRADKGKKSWQTFGYFVPLSTTQQLKSVPFPKVKRIIFDEFIPERGAVRELPNEHDIVLNLINTVDRFQEKTQMLMLANAVSIMSPHLRVYEVDQAPGTIRQYGDGKAGAPLVAIHIISSDEFNKSVAETRTARLFAMHEEYNAYATLNEFADNAPTMIEAKTSTAEYRWTIELSAGMFSVWRDDGPDGERWYVQRKRPKVERILTVDAQHMDDDKMLVTYADLPLSLMRTAFRHARMSFDTPTTRNAMTEIFKR